MRLSNYAPSSPARASGRPGVELWSARPARADPLGVFVERFCTLNSPAVVAGAKMNYKSAQCQSLRVRLGPAD